MYAVQQEIASFQRPYSAHERDLLLLLSYAFVSRLIHTISMDTRLGSLSCCRLLRRSITLFPDITDLHVSLQSQAD